MIDAASQRPLANVQVSIAGTGATVGALTNAQGTFRIPNVAVGQQTVRARLIGYAAATATAAVPPSAPWGRDANAPGAAEPAPVAQAAPAPPPDMANRAARPMPSTPISRRKAASTARTRISAR